ncbi:MAG: hypothetical protein ACI8WB_001474 [Phenylobacterium sp.]|jgi:hypothetical protein
MTDSNCIFKAGNIIEANVVKGLLQGEGIDVQLKGEHLMGALGELPPTDICVEVLVETIKLDAATVIIADYIASQKNTDMSDWTCDSCGEQNSHNFEICWQCQREPVMSEPEL